MSRPAYPERSWFDPRLEMRRSLSRIHGTGIFATQFIQAGERLAIWGGIVYSSKDWKTGKVQLEGHKYNEGQIDEDLFLATPKDDLDYWFNHSCHPNFGGDVARQDIHAGEEVTSITPSVFLRMTTILNRAIVARRCAVSASQVMIGKILNFSAGTVGTSRYLLNAEYNICVERGNVAVPCSILSF